MGDAASSCSSSDDCDGVERCIDGGCQRLELSDRFDWRLALSTVVMFVGAMLAAGGGLGGGGIFVPVYILILGLEPKEAVPISQATIFGGSIINMLMNYPLRNELIPTRPLIDYNAVLMLTPMLLAGTIVGVLLNIIFPSWLIVVCLALTLVYASKRTMIKGIKAWRQESLQRFAEGNSDQQSVEIELAPVEDEIESSEENAEAKPANVLLDALLYYEDHPYIQMGLIALVWVIVSVFSLLRGGGGGSSSAIGVETCTWQYWLLTLSSFAVLGLFTFVIGSWLLKNNTKKHELDWEPVQGEIDWNSRNTKIYPVFAMLAGLLGGLLGIGGGMILGPLLLEIGMKSRAVSTTSAAAVFITASSAAVQFLVLDTMLYDYALWFFGFGLFATFLGQTLINYLVKKFNRASFIILSIASVIGLATIMLVVSGVVTVMQDAKDGNLGFESLCR